MREGRSFKRKVLCVALTSAGVDLQLTVDVALIHQGVQNVQYTVYVPDLRVVPQEFNLLLRLLGGLAAVLAERLELEKVQSFFIFIYLYLSKFAPSLKKWPVVCLEDSFLAVPGI